jgi:putative transposase
MLSNFPKIVKEVLGDLPRWDYPALSTFRWVSCWLTFTLDPSLMSMRDLFCRLKYQGEKCHISTFSKANKTRDPEIFKELFKKLARKVNQKYKQAGISLYPLDSTTITLTSKLLCHQGFRQVKLFSGINTKTSEVVGVKLHFGNGHDHKHGNETLQAIPDNGVRILDRGFFSCQRIQELCRHNQLFVLRIKNDTNLSIRDSGKTHIGKGKKAIEVRVVSFCDLQKKTEYRLATNLNEDGELAVSSSEVAEIYRKRWEIELLWKFLKMHLKLDRLITKSPQGIEIQIYSSLIAYLLLNLIEIPEEFGKKLLDKFRYVQALIYHKFTETQGFESWAFLR